MNVPLQAGRKLKAFSARFRLWLFCSWATFFMSFIFDVSTDIPAVFAHLAMVASYRAFVKLGQTILVFCLPGIESGPTALISPESRMWRLIEGFLAVSTYLFLFLCRKLVCLKIFVWDNTSYIGDTTETAERAVEPRSHFIGVSSLPSRVAPSLATGLGASMFSRVRAALEQAGIPQREERQIRETTTRAGGTSTHATTIGPANKTFARSYVMKNGKGRRVFAEG
eukprot:CAMPEP_0194592828 /NCGR_PEP_ID=MMETSP0292-20121207/23065_1 /TAXON_ID=39354 /ORGANISM="Heterosigma akashiwo, Strain CCMP2393" /LENGTH=224 /DNA_ID=CAMNT_0039451511 /DNA_START=695 /DNA_END=1369 /DNA_ORIENTATION=-